MVHQIRRSPSGLYEDDPALMDIKLNLNHSSTAYGMTFRTLRGEQSCGSSGRIFRCFCIRSSLRSDWRGLRSGSSYSVELLPHSAAQFGSSRIATPTTSRSEKYCGLADSVRSQHHHALKTLNKHKDLYKTVNFITCDVQLGNLTARDLELWKSISWVILEETFPSRVDFT